MKLINLHLLTMSLLVAGIAACGSPKANPKLSPQATVVPDTKSTTDSEDAGDKAAKETKAEKVASLNRTIKLRKEALVRAQQNLSRKETLRNSLQTRITGAESQKAQGSVPQPISGGGGGGGGGDQGTAIATAAINIYAQKKSAEKNATQIGTEFSTIISGYEVELKAANEQIDAYYEQIKSLETEISDLTNEINSLSGGSPAEDEEA